MSMASHLPLALICRDESQGERGLIQIAKEDHPPETCAFGERGWINEDINVLTAIMNMTHQIQTGTGSK